jgi:hypothetical protein
MGLYEHYKIDESRIGSKDNDWVQLGPSFMLRSHNNSIRNRVRVAVYECRCGRIVLRECRKVSESPHCSYCKNKKAATRHGYARLAEYGVWIKVVDRCRNPLHPHFHNYGGRGITICDRWLESFENFYADMGPRNSPRHQIDRIDNDGNYEPKNCRWATRRVNALNRRNTVWVVYNGRNRKLAELAAEAGISERVVYGRVMKGGWSVEEAITVPVRPKARRQVKLAS